MEQRVIELEMKVAFLEDTVNQLDQVVCNQRDVIDQLRREIRKLTEQQETLRSQLQDDAPVHQVPPHY